jgi:hypothetical protein
MPSAAYSNRQKSLIFPSSQELERWEALAKKARMKFNRWVFSMVELQLIVESQDLEEICTQKTSLQSENLKLKRDKERIEARLEDLETEVFKLRNKLFAMEKPEGIGEFDKELLDLLRQGLTWSNKTLLDALDVDSSNVEAIQILTRQLQTLQDLKLVKESANGWRWIG